MALGIVSVRRAKSVNSVNSPESSTGPCVGTVRARRAIRVNSVKGTDEIIDSGRVGACDSFTLTDHTTTAMHEHAVDITRLVWLGCSAWLSCAAGLQRSCCAVAPPQCSMKEPLPALLTTLVYDGMDAACTASTESTSLLHHHAWHTVRGAEKLRRTNGCSRTARAACAAQPAL